MICLWGRERNLLVRLLKIACDKKRVTKWSYFLGFVASKKNKNDEMVCLQSGDKKIAAVSVAKRYNFEN